MSTYASFNEVDALKNGGIVKGTIKLDDTNEPREVWVLQVPEHDVDAWILDRSNGRITIQWNLWSSHFRQTFEWFHSANMSIQIS